MKILLVESKNDQFNALFSGLDRSADVEINTVNTIEQAIQKVKENTHSAVVVAEEVEGKPGLELIHKIVKTNPFINTVLQSGLPSDEFHEYTEGQGVLMQLSLKPGPEEAKQLVEKLEKVASLF